MTSRAAPETTSITSRFRARSSSISLWAKIVPDAPCGEQLLPWWVGSARKLQEARPVFKLALVPGWAAWVLRNRPGALVLHIVRHPGGFLDSWRRRYLVHNDPKRVETANRERLETLVKLDPSWGPLIGTIDDMSVDEAELWYWRYAGECIHLAGEGRSNYVPVVYESLVRDPAALMRRVFDRCGLPWTVDVERGIGRMSSNSGGRADAWRSSLNDEQTRIVQRILENCSLANFWTGGSR